MECDSYVSKFEKLLERIKNNPKTVRFEEFEKIMLRYGFKESQSGKGSSHGRFIKISDKNVTLRKKRSE